MIHNMPIILYLFYLRLSLYERCTINVFLLLYLRFFLVVNQALVTYECHVSVHSSLNKLKCKLCFNSALFSYGMTRIKLTKVLTAINTPKPVIQTTLLTEFKRRSSPEDVL